MTHPETATLPDTVACVSYLARVHTLNVAHHPDLNHGTTILSEDTYLAGDGPLVAGLLARFGHHTVLAANHPADDDAGRDLLARLDQWGVTLLPGPAPRAATRSNIVACDQDGNRTWYGDLQGVDAELAALDIAAVTSCDVVYIDGYDVLGATPAAVLDAATAAGRYVVLNLGGCPPPDWLTQLRRPVDVLQTNGSDTDPSTVVATLEHLVDLKVADLVVVTAGRHGARAVDARGTQWVVPATQVTAVQPQGAGAAFCAALIHTRGSGMDLGRRLLFACAAGTLWCTRPTDTPLPTAAEIAVFVAPHCCTPPP